MRFEDLSVVVPTLNSKHLIEPIADQMRAVLSEAGEIIVVDSYSEDGTLETLKKVLDFNQVTFHSRPRGLYASWNFGIQRSTKRWVHVSTAGDILSLDDLDHLYLLAESSQCDVVSSAPRFYNEAGDLLEDRIWPILELLQRYESEEKVELSGLELLSFALTYCRPGTYNGWLGSSASNVYKASVLKENPFPRDVGPIGDALWGLQNAYSVSACFTRRRCGRFVLHDLVKPFLPNDEIGGIFGRVWSNQAKFLLSKSRSGTGGIEASNFLHSLIENEAQSGELSRRLRSRIRRLVDLRDAYSDYVYESRAGVPRYLRRFFLPSLKRGEITLNPTSLDRPR